jgi:hypothetical protein
MSRSKSPETDALLELWRRSSEDNPIPPFDGIGGEVMPFVRLARKFERQAKAKHLHEPFAKRELAALLDAAAEQSAGIFQGNAAALASAIQKLSAALEGRDQ